MIAVETVIRKLVSEYEFVIIPGFGALLSHQVPAIYDKDSGIFAPPVKKLAFNEYLKLDDGLLANFISREEKITHLDAVSYVKKYTDILRSSLKTNGHTQVEGIGDFCTNVEGKLIFEPNTDRYFKDEWFGFTKVTARTFEDNRIQAPISNIHVEEEVEEIMGFDEAPVKINWMKWASAAAVAGLMFYFSFFLVSSNKENIKSTLNPFADLFKRESSIGNNTDKANSTPVAATVPLMKESVVKVTPRPDSVKKSLSNVGTAGSKDSVNTPTAVPVKNFYLIAGAFKGMKQAKVLLADLKSKGYSEAVIIPTASGVFKVKVAAAGFDAEKDAYQASAKLKNVIGEEGWVFKRR